MSSKPKFSFDISTIPKKNKLSNLGNFVNVESKDSKKSKQISLETNSNKIQETLNCELKNSLKNENHSGDKSHLQIESDEKHEDIKKEINSSYSQENEEGMNEIKEESLNEVQSSSSQKEKIFQLDNLIKEIKKKKEVPSIEKIPKPEYQTTMFNINNINADEIDISAITKNEYNVLGNFIKEKVIDISKNDKSSYKIEGFNIEKFLGLYIEMLKEEKDLKSQIEDKKNQISRTTEQINFYSPNKTKRKEQIEDYEKAKSKVQEIKSENDKLRKEIKALKSAKNEILMNYNEDLLIFQNIMSSISQEIL